MIKLLMALNGKKTIIGVCLLILLHGLTALFPDLLNQDVATSIENILLLFTGGVGLGHKIIKHYAKD